MSVCKFCGERKKLCKAHIVPRSFNYPKLPGEPSSVLTSNIPGFHTKRSQTGVYDTNILCSECDGKFGVLDNYAATKLLKNKNRKPYIHHGKIVGYDYLDCDFKIIEKFVLSMAWRASASEQEYYKKFKLGPYAEKIKTYLQDAIELPSCISVYPIEFTNTEKVHNRVPQLDPHKARHDGIRIMHMYANRFCFYIRTDKRPARTYDFIELNATNLVRFGARDFMKSKELDVLFKIVRKSR